MANIDKLYNEIKQKLDEMPDEERMDFLRRMGFTLKSDVKTSNQIIIETSYVVDSNSIRYPNKNHRKISSRRICNPIAIAKQRNNITEKKKG